MNNIKIKLEHRDLIVKKLPLGKYAELLKALKKLPDEISGLSGVKKEDIIGKIPAVIAESLPDFMEIFKIATDITDQELNTEIGLSEAIDIFEAIIEVNQFAEVYDKLKKVASRFQTPGSATMTTGSKQ